MGSEMTNPEQSTPPAEPPARKPWTPPTFESTPMREALTSLEGDYSDQATNYT